MACDRCGFLERKYEVRSTKCEVQSTNYEVRSTEKCGGDERVVLVLDDYRAHSEACLGAWL